PSPTVGVHGGRAPRTDGLRGDARPNLGRFYLLHVAFFRSLLEVIMRQPPGHSKTLGADPHHSLLVNGLRIGIPQED
ncbi:MAG: hypothetical protein OEV99_16840, partial [Nitrospira sp.]|nr:hypothetical protein [Nitrospira sp.]MDH5499129.1 hypothetical protein [Nitrospira sp.]